jgi:hypothetical protein
MNQQKTAMQQLIDYIDLLDSKNLPEYTISVATRLKAIELLKDEKQQIKEAYFNPFQFLYGITKIDYLKEIYKDVDSEFYYNIKFKNNENKI